eukprot:CAMPEP_0115040306 /NCGR_PEP_ID=MMETSP0216-20121206/44707_1 /TAXON_ID=223996 /ORGANISM="Protocruzia adherens, Strain Boccale" /LENGTH=75 /DNA_ID=CAMNT_0002421435 /DNA_START=96 /DNA_END=323 /DNA_ORIENTATION=-
MTNTAEEEKRHFGLPVPEHMHGLEDDRRRWDQETKFLGFVVRPLYPTGQRTEQAFLFVLIFAELFEMATGTLLNA